MAPQTKDKLAPFQLTYSPQVPEMLLRLNCSILLSTFQAGKLVVISPKDEDTLVQLPRNFYRPMGFAFSDDSYQKMALATSHEIIQFKNSKELAQTYPKNPGVYDALYLPTQSNYTGRLDLHDLSYGTNGQLFAVNTAFSCICTFNSEYNFIPVWQPSFITELKPEDRCHLNGLAMLNGKPKYVTAFATTNTSNGWKENLTETGVLIDIDTQEIILQGLGMPHTPRIINGELYLLLSATGQLIKVDVENKSYHVVSELGGFVRGMSYIDDYLFVGMNKLRKKSSSFGHLDVQKLSDFAGVRIIHLPTGTTQGELKYRSSVDEIFDIEVLPNILRANILNNISEVFSAAILSQENTYWTSIQDVENKENT